MFFEIISCKSLTSYLNLSDDVPEQQDVEAHKHACVIEMNINQASFLERKRVFLSFLRNSQISEEFSFPPFFASRTKTTRSVSAHKNKKEV